MSKNLAIIDYIVYLCLCIYLIVDTFNGITIIKYSISISQVFKSFILFLVIISILHRNNNQQLIISLYILLLILSILFSINKAKIDIYSTLLYIIKSITMPLFYTYFCTILKNGPASKHSSAFSNIFNINCIILLLNIIIGILGYGYNVYENFGVKGYFYAGNEVSLLFCCFYYYILLNRKRHLLIVYLLAFVCSILIGTKTAVLSYILISIIDFYYKQTKNTKFIIKLFFPFILVVVIECLYFIIKKTEFYQFIEYRIIGHIGQTDLLNLLLSGRIYFLQNTYNVWKNNFSLSTFLFGLGIQSPILKGIEIDFFDTFFTLGIIWLLIILFFYIKIIYLSIIKKNKKLFFFNIIILTISFTAGHVWSGVMAGVFFSYINAHELFCKEKSDPRLLR
jgi:hypothetical protein